MSTATASASTSQTIQVTDNDRRSVAITSPGTTGVTEGGLSANVGVTLTLNTSGTVGTAQLGRAGHGQLAGQRRLFCHGRGVFGVGSTDGATADVVVTAIDDLEGGSRRSRRLARQALSALQHGHGLGQHVADDQRHRQRSAQRGDHQSGYDGRDRRRRVGQRGRDADVEHQRHGGHGPVRTCRSRPACRATATISQAAAVFGVGSTDGDTADVVVVTAIDDSMWKPPSRRLARARR